MDFPKTNKYKQRQPESNAKLLEAKLKETDWQYVGKCYAVGFATFTLSLFVLIVAVRLALTLF